MRENLLIDVCREMQMGIKALEETNFGGEGWVERWQSLVQEMKNEIVEKTPSATEYDMCQCGHYRRDHLNDKCWYCDSGAPYKPCGKFRLKWTWQYQRGSGGSNVPAVVRENVFERFL